MHDGKDLVWTQCGYCKGARIVLGAKCQPCDGHGGWHDPVDVLATEVVELQNKLRDIKQHADDILFLIDSSEPAVETCAWSQDDEDDVDNGQWHTACGQIWVFNDGGPEDNHTNFCHNCGKKVRVVEAAEDEDSDA